MKIVVRSGVGPNAESVEAMSPSHALQWVDEYEERCGCPATILVDGKPIERARLEAMSGDRSDG